MYIPNTLTILLNIKFYVVIQLIYSIFEEIRICSILHNVSFCSIQLFQNITFSLKVITEERKRLPCQKDVNCETV